MSIAIIYGSNGGLTEEVAKEIQNELGLESELFDVADIEVNDIFDKFDKFIIGTSTWGEGELQDDWDEKFQDYAQVDFHGKTVAFFGLGDQIGYSDNFVDGMGMLHDIAKGNDANIVGDGWNTEGYDFDESLAVNENGFVGLAIDEDNQDDLTSQRVKEWIEIIKPHFQ